MTDAAQKTRFTLHLAGHDIDVLANYPIMPFVCKGYLSSSEAAATLHLELSMDEVLREAVRSNASVTGIENHIMGAYFESLALQRKVAEALVPFDILQVHGSTVAVDGEAYLFTAPSGTGKSTHTSLWRQHFGPRAVMVNDDKPLVRVGQGQVLACGTPWNGKHRLGTNIQVPLKAICFLERSERNAIRRIGPEEAFSRMIRQTYRPAQPELLARTVEVLASMLERVPAYIMDVNNFEDDAVHVAYQGMN